MKIVIENLTKDNMASKKRIKFMTEDSGVGIDDEDQAKLNQIFQNINSHQFNELDHEGVGLGLTICTKVIHEMGGSIKMNSQKGIGTQFSFELNLVC
jgi:K+-sensing histidine kinase KdpD